VAGTLVGESAHVHNSRESMKADTSKIVKFINHFNVFIKVLPVIHDFYAQNFSFAKKDLMV